MARHRIHICSHSVGLDEMPKRQQRDRVAVLRMLEQAGRFSVFEVTANQTIARTVQGLIDREYVTTSIECGFPWTTVELTDAGRALLTGAGVNP